MLRKIFFAVPRRLVALEHGPGLGIIHHRTHELAVSLQVGVDVLDLPFQRVKAVRGLGRPVSKLRIICQAVLLDIGQRRGHLLDIESLGPSLIAGAFACLHTSLDVDCQADFAPRHRPAFTAESGAYILRAVARAECFSPQPCKSLLPWSPES